MEPGEDKAPDVRDLGLGAEVVIDSGASGSAGKDPEVIEPSRKRARQEVEIVDEKPVR